MAVIPGRLTTDGVWLSQPVSASRPPRPGLFLDRDGVLVKEVNYLHRVEEVQLETGAAALVRWANDRMIPVVVVTNQSGIDRGMFGWEEFEAVQRTMAEMLLAQGARIDLTIACSFHPQHTPGWSARHAVWRKPGPGMLLLGAKHLNIVVKISWMVGDTESDMAAAKAAGLVGAVHLLTGHGSATRTAALGLGGADFAVLPANTAGDALPLLQNRFGAEQ